MKEMFILLLIFVYICNGTKKKSVVTIDRYEMCGTPLKSQGMSVETIIHTSNHQSVINATVDFYQDVEKLSLYSTLTRCQSKENLNTCQFFGKMPLPDACALLASNDTMFSTIDYNFIPPFICPFKKGRYILRNGYLNAQLPFFPMEGYYWKIAQEYYNKKTGALLMNLCLEGQFFSVFA